MFKEKISFIYTDCKQRRSGQAAYSAIDLFRILTQELSGNIWNLFERTKHIKIQSYGLPHLLKRKQPKTLYFEILETQIPVLN